MARRGLADSRLVAKQRMSRGERASLLTAAGVMIALWALSGAFALENARRHDYLNMYTGATLALNGEWGRLHDIEAQLAVERLYVPNLQDLVPYVRPHFHAFALAPLALLSFGTAFWAWIAIQTALYCGFGIWATKRFGLESLVFWSLFAPGALSIAHGQDAPVLLAVIGAGYVLAERGRLTLAGLVWSLALMKFHLCLGLLLALLVGRQWKVLAGFAAGGLGLAVFSVGLAGRQGTVHYISMLTNKNLERLSPGPQQMSDIQGVMANLGIGSLWFALVAGALTLALLVRAAWKAPLTRVLSAGLAGGLFLVPHTYLYDTTALLLPLLLAVQPGQPKPLRLAAFALIAPIVPLMALFEPPISVAPALALFAFLAALAFSAHQLEPDQVPTS